MSRDKYIGLCVADKLFQEITAVPVSSEGNSEQRRPAKPRRSVMSKLIVIPGITGAQGGSVANTYLKSPGWKVRGTTRNVSSETAKIWQEKGAEIVEANFDNLNSLVAAFQGANVIFGVTDFWTIFKDKESHKKKKADQDITHYCFEVELTQAKNLADSAAQIPTLERYVFSSMANASKWSNGKFSRLYHMDSKALAVDYALSLPGLQGKFSQVQAAIYYNLLWEWGMPTTPKKENDGSYHITAVGSGDVPIPFLDVHRDFGTCVQAVVNTAPGTNFFAVSEMLSWNQYLDIWCESQSVPRGKYNQISLEKFAEFLPGGLGREFGENVLFAQEFGYVGGDPVMRPAELGVKMTMFRDYCNRTDFSTIL